MSVDWKFVAWTFFVFFVFVLDAIFRERVLRKLDWFIYERPVLRRLEREKRKEEEKRERERVICTHEGPYR